MKVVVARQGESDFDDDAGMRSGWLTDNGRCQMSKLARTLEGVVDGRIVIVVSNSKRGRTTHELFLQSPKFRDVAILRDLGYWLDDSHPEGTRDSLAATMLALGEFDSIVLVGQLDRVCEFAKKYYEKMGKTFPANDVPNLNNGQAYVFDFDTGEGHIV